MSTIIKTTRKAIFKDIREKTLTRTSEKYDISMNELLKVCEPQWVRDINLTPK